MPPVLIVDDDPATREALSDALEMVGFAVRSASGGDEALRVAVREQPAAVVVDFRMPGMSGVEVINRMLAMPGMQDLCAVLTTAWPKVPSDLHPSALVLEKPFSLDRLLEHLERRGVSASRQAAQ